MDNQGLIFFIAGVFIFAGLILAFVSFWRRGTPKDLNVDKYRSEWMTIEQRFRNGSESDFHLSILEADKLVDRALRDLGYAPDKTMADRLRQAAKKFSDVNGMWQAHKLRNRIAHETGVKVSQMDARRALAQCKQALKDIGAI